MTSPDAAKATLRARWQSISRHPQFRRGIADSLPMLPGISAWGLVTGVAMVKSGLTVPLALAMSLIVYAGSSQLAALPLMAAGAPLWVVWLTAFVVNLRFVIYSAHWRIYFGNQSRGRRLLLSHLSADIAYVSFLKAWPEPRQEPGQLHYLGGCVSIIWFAWQIPSILGIVFANAIPTQWGLEFAGTLALLGLVGSLLADRATWTTAIVAGGAAIAAYSLPYKLNIVVAVAAALVAGVLMEPPLPPGRATRVGSPEAGGAA